MLLVLDVGNTDLTLGLVQDGTLLGSRRARTRPEVGADELELTLDGLLGLDGTSLADIDGAACASVVPSVTDAVEAIAGRRGLPLLLAGPATVPLEIGVERPAEVGPDRLVNVLAARELYGSPAIVVDLGTATTFDVLAADGTFAGGAIAPGLALGLDALATHTARLPRVPLAAPGRLIARDTVGALQAGAVGGYLGLVSSLLSRMRAELAETDGLSDPRAIPAILTGGLSAAPWARRIEGVDAIDPDLTLKGLAICYRLRGAPGAVPTAGLAGRR